MRLIVKIERKTYTTDQIVIQNFLSTSGFRFIVNGQPNLISRGNSSVPGFFSSSTPMMPSFGLNSYLGSSKSMSYQFMVFFSGTVICRTLLFSETLKNGK